MLTLPRKGQGQRTGATALRITSEPSHADIMQALRHAEATKDRADETGATPLRIALETSHPAIVHTLLDADAAKDKANGQVQLHFASLQSRARLTSSRHSETLTVQTCLLH